MFADAPCAVQTFEVPSQPNVRYAVLVNHDTAAQRDCDLLLMPNVRRLTDVVSGRNLAVTPATNDPAELLQSKVSLQAGDGTVLKIEFRNDRPGILLFADDFSCSPYSLLLENAERRCFAHGFGLGEYWAVVKSVAKASNGVPATPKAGQAAHDRTPQHASRSGPSGRALGLVAQHKLDIFVAVDGDFPKAESLIVERVDKDGKETWLQSDAHFHPVRIPAQGIEELRFLLGNDAVLRGVRCWCVSKTP